MKLDLDGFFVQSRTSWQKAFLDEEFAQYKLTYLIESIKRTKTYFILLTSKLIQCCIFILTHHYDIIFEDPQSKYKFLSQQATVQLLFEPTGTIAFLFSSIRGGCLVV